MSYHLISKTTVSQSDCIMTFIQNKGIPKPPISTRMDIISKFSKNYPLPQHDKVLWIASRSLLTPVSGQSQCQGGWSTMEYFQVQLCSVTTPRWVRQALVFCPQRKANEDSSLPFPGPLSNTLNLQALLPISEKHFTTT